MKTLYILIYLVILIGSVFLFGCTKDEPEKLPIVTTESTTSNITATTAQSGGNITDTKGEIVTASGICWSINSNPTIKDSITKETNGSGKYVSQMLFLQPNTQYFVRAYATNRFGTAYGDIISFKTLVDIVKLTTTDINTITSTTALGGGDITDDGNGIISERGVCWSSTPNPTILNCKTSDGTGKGNFNSNMSGLTRNNTYYVRAYAKNDVGISYGSQVTFKTLAELPAITTTLPSNVGENSVQLGGNVIDNGGVELIAKGICYGTNHNPTLTDSQTNSGTTSGAWATVLTGIRPSTTYFVRAYATNSIGTTYGDEISFITLASPHSSGTITDIDGNVYKTITIGNQTWMAENLKTTRNNDGSFISNLTDLTAWDNTTDPAYCWPNNDVANKNTYGALYNWYAAANEKLAPSGWHVATINEWRALKAYLINNNYFVENVTTNVAKAIAGNYLWNTSTNIGTVGNNLSINNSSGFNAIPSGFRDIRRDFSSIGYHANWWTPDICYDNSFRNPYNISITYDVGSLDQWFTSTPNYGYSVRCVKD